MIEKVGQRVIRDYLPDQHREFYAELPFVLLGTVDGEGRPWASLVPGRPGFMSTPDARSLDIGMRPLFGDPLNQTLQSGAHMGVLGIQPDTRRRNRMSGRIAAIRPEGFTITVDHAFGNCPQYIQTRTVETQPDIDQPERERPVSRLGRFDDTVRQMIERAAYIWDVPAENVDLVDGVFQHRSDPELRFTFKELASLLLETGGPIVGRAAVNPGGVGGAFAVHIADVEVDPETGKTQVLRYTALQDAGKAVHPSYVEGQMQGGAVQGIGWALNEEYFFDDDGRMTNSSFLDYRMPTSLDLPMIDTEIVEVANPGHPYGVRGVGEIPIVPPMAAIANAIKNAVGVRMTSLPMSPGEVLKALWDSEESKNSG